MAHTLQLKVEDYSRHTWDYIIQIYSKFNIEDCVVKLYFYDHVKAIM